MGRVAGQTIGGLLVTGDSFRVVGVVALALLVGAGACIEAVATGHRWR